MLLQRIREIEQTLVAQPHHQNGGEGLGDGPDPVLHALVRSVPVHRGPRPVPDGLTVPYDGGDQGGSPSFGLRDSDPVQQGAAGAGEQCFLSCRHEHSPPGEQASVESICRFYRREKTRPTGLGPPSGPLPMTTITTRTVAYPSDGLTMIGHLTLPRRCRPPAVGADRALGAGPERLPAPPGRRPRRTGVPGAGLRPARRALVHRPAGDAGARHPAARRPGVDAGHGPRGARCAACQTTDRPRADRRHRLRHRGRHRAGTRARRRRPARDRNGQRADHGPTGRGGVHPAPRLGRGRIRGPDHARRATGRLRRRDAGRGRRLAPRGLRRSPARLPPPAVRPDRAPRRRLPPVARAVGLAGHRRPAPPSACPSRSEPERPGPPSSGHDSGEGGVEPAHRQRRLRSGPCPRSGSSGPGRRP